MKRILTTTLSLFLCTLLALTATSCSKGASADFSDEFRNNSGGASIEEKEDATGSVTGAESTDKKLAEGRKIIQNLELSLQTKEFLSLMEKLEKEIADLGGYVEESSTNGLDPDSYRYRSAHLVVRIPVEKSGSFDAFLSENSVVTSRRITTEDVTLQYVDMESRVKALNLEKEALEEILKKAESVEDIIKVRTQLTNVIHEIESYQSKLRTFDNLVDYCTVNIYVNEVERTAVVEKQSIWQKIGTNLVTGFENVGKAMVAIFVFLISAIPYFLPFAVIIALIIILIKVQTKKKKKAKTENNPNAK